MAAPRFAACNMRRRSPTVTVNLRSHFDSHALYRVVGRIVGDAVTVEAERLSLSEVGVTSAAGGGHSAIMWMIRIRYIMEYI
jgi:hypothetical protein